MDWNGTRADDRRVLKRIVGLLFAFASLAERAGARHYLVRASVLWVLRFAETVAHDFVLDTAFENGAPLTPAVLLIPALHDGDNSADAMLLARSFRALAVLLDRMADCNPGHGDISIALAARAANGRLPAAAIFRAFCLAPPGYAIERHDSS
jgi:hypothetical protein